MPGQRQEWGTPEVAQVWAGGKMGSPEAGHYRSQEPLSWTGLTQWGFGPGSHMAAGAKAPDFQDTVAGPFPSCVPWTKPCK